MDITDSGRQKKICILKWFAGLLSVGIFFVICWVNARFFIGVYQDTVNLLLAAAGLGAVLASKKGTKASNWHRTAAVWLITCVLSVVVFMLYRPAYTVIAAVRTLEKAGVQNVCVNESYAHIGLTNSTNILVTSGYVFSCDGEDGENVIVFDPVNGGWYFA